MSFGRLALRLQASRSIQLLAIPSSLQTSRDICIAATAPRASTTAGIPCPTGWGRWVFACSWPTAHPGQAQRYLVLHNRLLAGHSRSHLNACRLPLHVALRTPDCSNTTAKVRLQGAAVLRARLFSYGHAPHASGYFCYGYLQEMTMASNTWSSASQWCSEGASAFWVQGLQRCTASQASQVCYRPHEDWETRMERRAPTLETALRAWARCTHAADIRESTGG